MKITFENFKNEWLKEIKNSDLVKEQTAFSRKILSNWLDIDPETENFIEFKNNSVIDIAYFHEDIGESEDNEKIWYFIKYQKTEDLKKTDITSDYAKSFFEFIKTNNTPELSELNNFIERTNGLDKIILIFCFDDIITNEIVNITSEIQETGRKELTPFFYTEFVNINAIYERILELENKEAKNEFVFKANINESSDLFIGSILLVDLYNFMQNYEKETNDIDRLYEKNVRKYLGGRRKVNKGIKRTILIEPKKFGLFNNGITIITSGTSEKKTNSIKLIEPYIVNGAQTTKTLWETFDSDCMNDENVWNTLLNKAIRTENPKPQKPKYEEWQNELQDASVVVKIVKLTDENNQAIRDITKYTNSQTAVTAKDFLAVNDDFNQWKDLMSSKYNIYLEIQRGGWTSQKAKQIISPQIKPYFKSNQWINAFDLIKVFSAAWLGEVGSTFGKTPPFSPGGTIFKKIINNQSHEDNERTIHINNFGINDLYCAFLLHRKTTNDYKFGRSADKDKKAQRGSTRYLFYYTVIRIIKDILLNSFGKEYAYQTDNITSAFLSLNEPINSHLLSSLMDTAADIVDEYLTKDTEDNIFEDPEFKDYENNLNRILKSPSIGKTTSFNNIIAINIRVMKRITGGFAPYTEITNILK